MEISEDIKAPGLQKVLENGQITSKSGHHEIKENSLDSSLNRCRCSHTLTGENKSYRHIKARLNEDTIYYWHQTPYLVKHGNGDITIPVQPYKNKAVMQRLEDKLPKEFYTTRYKYDDGERHSRAYIHPPGADKHDSYRCKKSRESCIYLAKQGLKISKQEIAVKKL